MRRVSPVLLSLLAVCSCSTEDATPTTPRASASSASGGASASSASGGASGASSAGGPSDAGGDGDAASTALLDPPGGGSSKGSGGAVPANGVALNAGAVTYRLIVSSSYKGAPTPLLIVFSGVEGGVTMTSNLVSLGPFTQTDGFVRAVLDGVTYNDDAQAGAAVLDDVRAKYNIDNDRTYLIGESAGTTAALKLGLRLRQSYFAAYWANDVTASDTPEKAASALGFAPNGQAGPGGNIAAASAIVNAMSAAGYRLPVPAPYAGPGSTQHGNPDQFIAALSWLPGKSRLATP